MKKKIILGILLVIMIVITTGCGNNSVTFDGKEIILDKEYKDTFVTYKYPSSFKEVTGQPNYPLNLQKSYEYYNDDKLSFIFKVEEYSLGLSFAKMEEDAKSIENDKENKDIERTTIKVNGKNFLRYAFKRNDEFGENTVHFVYYGGYSFAGIYEYIKIYLINVEGKDGVEKAFLSSFKIND